MRTRLTLWYVAVLSGVLVLYAASALFFLRLALRRELDRALDAQFEGVEDLLVQEPDGTVRMGGHGDENESGRFVEVWSSEGRLLYRGEGLREGELGEAPRPGLPGARTSHASVKLGDDPPRRVLSHRYHFHGRLVLVRIGASERWQRHAFRELLVGLFFGLPVALAIAAFGGHWLARRSLRPLDRMARHAERLTAENLGERLPVENPDDELGHLASVFNLSLARIERSFAELRRFTADASHELRTPLTAIRTVGEVALQEEQKPERYREAIGNMLVALDRLSRLVGSLLTLSRGEASPSLRRQEVRLLDLARESASLLGILAEERGQTIEVRGDGGVTAEVDGLILRQALINLVDNAIKYSPPGAAIVVEVRGDAGGAVVDVVDQGPGIPEEHRARVFERFYRVDAARSREEGGAGLGLSIALWAAQAHGGRIELVSQEGKGSTFRILLPTTGQKGAAESEER